MKSTPNTHIYDLWANGGDFIGTDAAPCGRVTVELDWALQHSTATSFDNGHYDRGPLRWFQRTDASQVETEVPRILTIDIDRSIDTDAATCKITMINSQVLPNGTTVSGVAQGPTQIEPGHYWMGHGDTSQADTLWGYTPNEWNAALQPNALIRTYQGYGGRTTDIPTAVAAGNIVQTGTWLVDSVEMDAATGIQTLNCRDMVKLLIEQMLYPPLVPQSHSQSVHYPLSYNRWKFTNHPVVPYGVTIYNVGFTPYDQSVVFGTGTSSGDASGHPTHDAKDGIDPDSYWLSDGALAASNQAYIQFPLNGSPLVGGINIQPYGGNYTMYVSINASGTWQGSDDDGIGLNYVSKQGVGWEQAARIDLGSNGPWNADYIRLTFTNLAKTSIGPQFYRAGVRDLQVGYFTSYATGGGRTIVGMSRGHNDSNNGYWLAGSDGGVFTFGDLKFYGSEGSAILNQGITGIAGHPGTGKGYRLCGTDGGVFCFGDMRFKGSLPGNGTVVSDVVDIANGDAGAGGYYLLELDGTITPFGDANSYGNSSLGGACVAMVANDSGYWVIDGSGTVERLPGGGTASPPGGFGIGEDIEVNSTGDGYWIVDHKGQIGTHGTAGLFADQNGNTDASSYTLNDVIVGIVRAGDDQGYWLVGADGGVFAFGSAMFKGSLPQQFSAVGDGNYLDYIDIVKDILLWSGWWFYDPNLGDASPATVFGNLESTGIFSPDNLTEDFFDKKPGIDVINTLKEVVGYIIYADEEGAFHFQSPNVWTIGNFLDTGLPTSLIPTIDEKKQIIAYTVNVNDTDARSLITIASDEPTLDLADTKSVTIVSQWGGALLRGICRPALWVNGKFLTTGAPATTRTATTVMATMANLIDLHLFMQQRQGSLTMPANPVLQIDDQVRIFERSTSETYIHYLRGYSSHQDIQSGEYTMTLQTHWMGDGTAWFLSYAT